MCILGIFLLASASASDLNETVVSEIDDDVISIDDIQGEIIAEGVENSESLCVNHTPQNFNEIQTSIESASDGDTIILDGSYLFESTITVDKSLNFVGKNNATIDGNNDVKLFSVNAHNVVFRDIVFVNARTAINAAEVNGDCTVVNCSFIGNGKAANDGGALYVVSAVNCSFINNTVSTRGGAMYDGSAVNCTFINNAASSSGGAMYGGSAVNCTFINNAASGYYSGGALYDVSAVNCIFINNTGSRFGGAMYGGSAVNCSFLNNNAYQGGAIAYCNAFYSTFDSNVATYEGGAIIRGHATNCTFVNNYAQRGGGIFSYSATNCSFINNRADEGGAIAAGDSVATNCIFINNSARNGGAIVHGASASKCIFINNTASASGGAMNGGSAEYCIFEYNEADYAGGAIYNGDGKYCTFNGNKAYEGGAMYAYEDDVYYSSFSVFNNNSACNGGATYRIVLRNSNFTGNNASENGGAMNGGSAVNCIFISNHAENYGGAVFSGKVSVNSQFNYNSANIGNDTYNATFFDEDVMKTFSALNDIINGNNDSEVYLNCNYTFDSVIDYEFKNGININRTMTIYGNGFTLNGMDTARIFYVSNKNVVFRDIVFVNARTAINAAEVNGDCTVVNCSFIGNGKAANDGGALYVVSAVNCSFINNTASTRGGAMYGGSALNCTFINNAASGYYSGGALYDVAAVNCIFINNTGSGYGGAMYYGSAVNCSFFNNNAYQGGAIAYCNAFYSIFDSNIATYEGGAIIRGHATNCTFVNNYAQRGGGLFSYSATNCSFINNRADEGGAIAAGDSVATNCIFINNSARNGGAITHGASASKCTFINNTASASGGAMRGGSAVNCSFSGNSVGGNLDSVNGTAALDCIFDVYPTNNYHYTSYIDVNNFIVYESNNKFLIAKLYDIRGPATNKTVIFNIGGNNYNATTDNNGLAKLNIVNIFDEYGSFSVFVTFDGDDVNYAVSSSTIVTVKSYSNLNVNNLSIFIEDNEFLVVNLSDDNGPLFGKLITISVSNKGYNLTTDFNGLARFDVKKLLNESGSYDVNVKFEGDEFTSPSSTISHVVIKKYDSILEINDLNLMIGENGTLIAKLYDSRGQLSGKNVSFTIDGKTYLGTTDGGVARLDIDGMDAGDYNVTVSFGGDEHNNPVAVNSQVIINRYDSKLDVNDVFIVLGDECILIANLSNVYAPLVDREVTFSIGNSIYVYQTDSNGLARFDKDIFNEYGTFIVRVDFAGDKYNNPVSTNASICINKNIYNMTIAQSGKYYDDTNLTFKLVDSKTNVNIADTPVTLMFSNGVVYNGTTDSNGEVVYEVPFAPGNYSVDLRINQSNIGINKFGLYDFEILKVIGRISVVQDKDCRILNIKLFNPSNGEVFKNFNITLAFGPIGEEFNVITDDNGCVSYNMTFEYGTYSVIVSVFGDYVEFNSVRLDNIVINNNSNSEIHVPDSYEFNYLETGYIGVNVEEGSLNESDIYIDNHPEADINLNGNVITISNLTADNYELHIKSTPTLRHNSVTRTMLVIVNKVDCRVRVSNFTVNYGETGFATVAIAGGNIGSVSVVGHPEAIIYIEDDKVYVSNLTVGNYTLSVSANPDENHKSVTSTAEIVVNKADCIIDAEAISFEYGDLGFTNFIVVGGSIGNASIVGYPEIKPNVFGNRITVSGLDVGNYTLLIDTAPDENHNKVTLNVSVIVREKESSVEFIDIVHPYYGGYGYYYLTANYCQILKENISVDGHPEASIDFDGKKITISNLAAGNYLLNVVSTPDKNYKSVTQSTEIIVNQVNSNVFFSPDAIVFDYLQSGSTRITVDGGNVSYQNIKFVGHPEAAIEFDGEMITVWNLTAGNYTLYVTTTPDKDHKSVTYSIDVIVNKIDLEVNFTNEIEFDDGGFGFTNVTVTGGSLGEIYVINHTEAVVNISGNSIFVSNLTFGNYTLCVNTTPDVNHNSIKGLLRITVSKVPTIIEFTNEIVFDYNGVGNTTVNVLGGSILVSDITVLGSSEAEFTINNKNMIFVSNLTVGSYILQVKSTPDENHRSSIGNVSITVNKIQSSIICEDIIFDYDKFGFSRIDVEGGILNISDVYIVNHTDVNLHVSSDSVTFSDLNAGNYSLHISSIPDKNHYGIESFVKVIVIKIDSTVIFTPNNIVFDYLSSSFTVVQVNGGEIDPNNITLAGYPKAQINFNNGIIYVSNLNAGQYNLTVKTIPDENHKSVIANVSVTVNKIASSIKFSNNIVFDYSKSGSTTVETVGGSIGAVGVVDHPEIKPKVSGNKITVSGLDVGSYKLRVAINPDGNHKYDERFATITVKKVSGKIKASSKSVVLKKGTKWTVKLTDSKGNPISGVKIKFKVSKGKTIEVATNSKGEASYNTKKLSKGKHKVVVSVSHAGYNVKSVTSSIKVVKQTKLKFKSTSNKNKDSTTVMFRVYKGGKPANGIKLKLLIYTGKKVVKTIKLKSKTFKKKKGIVGYTTNELSAGKHKVVLKPVDIKYSGSKKGTLKLTKKQTKYPPISSKV